LNIVKTDFFISLKGHKSRSTFANFCFSSHKDDFYISISAKPLKAGPTRPNALEGGTPKPDLHRPKDCQRSEVSEEVNTRDNGFKDLSSWESTERGPRMPEDRPYKPVESQEMTVRLKQASISGLNPETSRGTAKERPCMLAELRNVKETDDTCKNPKGYNILLQLINLWYIRLKHLSLNLFQKTAKIINGIPNLDAVKEKDFICLAYNRSKVVRKLNLRALLNPLKILNILKRDIFKIKFRLYNKRPVGLFIIDCKLQFRWVIFLSNR